MCPHETVTYSCKVTDTTWIKWLIQRGPDIDAALLNSANDIGDTNTNSADDLIMTLISKTGGLTATATFKMTLDVNNTSILCDDELISIPDPNDGCYVALQCEISFIIHNIVLI